MKKIFIFTLAFIISFHSVRAQESFLMIQLQKNLQEKFHSNILTYRLVGKDRELATFYEKNDFHPQWITLEGLTPSAAAILDTLKEADKEGLEPKDYLKKISLVEKLTLTPLTTESLNSLEILISELALNYIDDLFGERLTPKKISTLLYINPLPVSASEILYKGNKEDPSGLWFKDLTIQRRDYQLLKNMLKEYRFLLKQNSWVTLPTPVSFKSFEKDQKLISQLQNALKQYGFYQGEFNGIFDTETKQALSLFQSRYGQEPDGKLGPETVKALNTPLEERIKQVIVTMERWRWFPQDIQHHYLLVNIPGFTLTGYKDQNQIIEMPIIIGQKLRKTPVFSSSIFEIRFNPTWYVPRSIAVKDKLPLLRHDPSEMIKKGYIIRDENGNLINPLNINWSQITPSDFPFLLTQSPGSLNALGRIFFNIKSPFDIFLHDTPDTGLFKKAKRNFSSGCIRVSKPIDLALFVLDGMKDINADTLQNKIDSNQTSSIRLETPLPVHITYLTIWFDKNEISHFSDDIYDLDQKIWNALQKRTKSLQ